MAAEITVEVELKGLLERYARPEEGASFRRRLPAGSTVGELLAGLDLPARRIGLVAVNGGQVARDRALADGDRVQLFPPFLAGG